MLNARVRNGGPWLRLLLPVAVGIVVGSGALVLVRTEATSLRYQLSRLIEQEDRLREQVEKLRVEVAALSAADRVEPRATQLGMIYPRPGQVVSLPPVASDAGPVAAGSGNDG